jgi:hypothetical protein
LNEEIGAEIGEAFRHLGGAAVRVEQKSTGGKPGMSQCVKQRTEGIEAMNRGGEAARGGELELPVEDLHLLCERRPAQTGQPRVVRPRAVEDPAIESDLADAGVRVRGERGEQVFLPVGGTVARIHGCRP